jgi:hypothetical protein
LTDDQVAFLFNQYMDNGPVTASRKFYFHTDLGRLQELFSDLQSQGFESITAFPDM